VTKSNGSVEISMEKVKVSEQTFCEACLQRFVNLPVEK
jgi:hypothetical protein